MTCFSVNFLLRRYCLLYAILAVASYVFVHGYMQRNSPLCGDGLGYYSYLPAIIIYGDPTLASVYNIQTAHPEWQQNIIPANVPGRYFIKYPIGVALLICPFFVIAHGVSLLAGQPVNGFGLVYEHAVGLAGIVFIAIGLHFLRKILIRHFSANVALLTLVSILFGTGLFNLAIGESLFSHGYSFAVIAAFVALLPDWIKHPTVRKTLLLGILLGLNVLLRNNNVILGLYAVLFVYSSLGSLQKTLNFCSLNWRLLLGLAVTIILICVPQVVFWKYSMGSWLVYSYNGEGFDFLQPQFLNGLFSLRKGLFFYYPVLLFSLAGFFYLRRKLPRYFFPATVYLAINSFVLISWECWWYGVCFGNRAFLDTLSLFALPMACFYSSLSSVLSKRIVIPLVLACCAFTSTLALGYWMGLVPGDKMSIRHFQRFLAQQEVLAPVNVRPGETIQFTPGQCESVLGKGFYAPRENGTWNKALRAKVRFRIVPQEGTASKISIRGEIARAETEVNPSISLGINGISFGPIAISQSGEFAVTERLDEIPDQSGIISITFITDRLLPFSAIDPEAQEAKDKLMVGFLLKSIAVD